MERTPVRTLKAIVSWESIDRPEGQPEIERRPPMSASAETSSGTSAAPSTISVPSTPRPPMVAVIALPLVTVARMTRAPPSRVSSSAGSWDWLSM